MILRSETSDEGSQLCNLGLLRLKTNNGFIRVDVQQGPGHELVTIDRVKTQTGCIVVPVTPDGKIVLIREVRTGAGCAVIGVVKGAKDTLEESDRVTAERELLEELGMSASEIEITDNEVYALPSLTSTRGRVVFAHGCTVSTAPQLEADEEVEVYRLVDENELARLLLDGSINDAESSVALHAYLLSRLVNPLTQ